MLSMYLYYLHVDYVYLVVTLYIYNYWKYNFCFVTVVIIYLAYYDDLFHYGGILYEFGWLLDKNNTVLRS